MDLLTGQNNHLAIVVIVLAVGAILWLGVVKPWVYWTLF